MKRAHKWVLLLFAGLVALTVLLVGPGVGFRAEDQDHPWPSVQRKDVTGIALHSRAGGYTLVREHGTWWVRSPELQTSLLADERRVAAFTDMLFGSCPKERLSADALPYDKAETVAVISVNDAHAAHVVTTPEGVFLEHGSDAYAFPQWTEDAFLRPASWFHDNRLLVFDVDAIERVVVSPLAGDEWEARRTDDGYAFVRPQRFAGDGIQESALELFLHRLSSLTADVAREVELPDDAQPDLRIHLQGRGAEHDLGIYIMNGGRLLARSSRQPASFLLDQAGLHKLDLNAFSLVDRRLFGFLPGTVSKVSLTQEGREYGVMRGDDGWVNEMGDREHAGIDMLLWRLTSLQYELGPAPLPDTATRALDVALTTTGSAQLNIAFFRDPALPVGQCWVRPSSGSQCYPVDGRMLIDLEGLLPALTQAGSGA